jgi:hypothetical protein
LQRNLYLGYSSGNGAPDSPLTDLRIEANGFATLTPRNHGLAQANLDRLTRLLMLVIALAVVLNGLPFWARSRWIGWPRRIALGKFGVRFRPAAPMD